MLKKMHFLHLISTVFFYAHCSILKKLQAVQFIE